MNKKMNEREFSQILRKPGKVRVDPDGMLVGNTRIPKRNCDEIFRSMFGKEPTGFSSYYEMVNAAVKLSSGIPYAEVEKSKRYSFRNYD